MSVEHKQPLFIIEAFVEIRMLGFFFINFRVII